MHPMRATTPVRVVLSISHVFVTGPPFEDRGLIASVKPIGLSLGRRRV